jgi:hypothetical protein
MTTFVLVGVILSPAILYSHYLPLHGRLTIRPIADDYDYAQYSRSSVDGSDHNADSMMRYSFQATNITEWKYPCSC